MTRLRKYPPPALSENTQDLTFFQELTGTVEDIVSINDTTTGEIEIAAASVSDISQRLEEAERELSAIPFQDPFNLVSKIEVLQKEIAMIPDYLSHISNLEEKFNSLQKEISMLCGYESQIAELRSKIESLQKELNMVT